MELRTQIHGLAAAASTDFDACIEYYLDTRAAWRLIQQQVQRRGLRFTVSNELTGDQVDESEFVRRSQTYLADYLRPHVLHQLVAAFEDFVFGVMEAWFYAHPEPFGRREVRLADALRAASLDELIRNAIRKVLNELRYRGVSDWFHEFAKRSGVAAPDTDAIDQLAELKSTRDVHAHAMGLATPTYLQKAGRLARAAICERLDVDEPYLLGGYRLLGTVASEWAIRAEDRAKAGR